MKYRVEFYKICIVAILITLLSDNDFQKLYNNLFLILPVAFIFEVLYRVCKKKYFVEYRK